MKSTQSLLKILGIAPEQGTQHFVKTLFDAMPEAIAIINKRSGILECNPKFWQVLHAELEQMPEDLYCFAGFVHPQDLLLYQQSVAKCFQEGSALFEGRLMNAQGQTFWGEVMLRFLKNEEDEFAQLILRDLSDVRQEQSAYKELKSRIERIGESTPNLMLYQFLLKANGQMSFPYVSAGSIDVYGIPCQEIMQDAQKLLDTIHPDDAASFQMSVQRSATELSDWVWEGRSYYRGELRWIRGNARPERLADGSVLWTGAVINITERKKAEEEVKILSLVAKKTDNAVIITDEHGVIEWVNEGFTKISEYSLEDVKGKKPGQVLQGPATDPAHVQKIREGLASRKSFHQEILNYSKSGRPYWLSLNITPVFNEFGDLLRFIAIESDITAQKEREAMMQQLSLVASKTDNAVIITNKHGAIEWVNEGFTKISEYTLEEVKGKKPGHVLQGADTDPAHVQKIREGLNSGKSFRQEILNYTKSGRAYWLALSISPVFNQENEITHFIAIESDITEQKQIQEILHSTQERLDLAIKGSNDGIWDWDIQRNKMYFSPTWKRMLGYQPEEIEDSFAAFEQLVHPDDLSIVQEHLSRYLQGKSSMYAVKMRMLRKEGEYAWILARGVALRDADGNPYRMAGSHTDITGIKEFEEHLKMKNEELLAGEEELRQNMEELQATQEVLALQKDALDLHNKKMIHSINYALTIQNAIMPQQGCFEKVAKEHFVLFKPKDIVSGDFYWCSKVSDTQYLVAAIDCTGHGVPGALMSMIGHSILNELIHLNGMHLPGQILKELHYKICEKLKQKEGRNKDGMDLGFCLIEQLPQGQVHITFAGARNTMYYVHKGELLELRGDRKPIGGLYAGESRDYQNQSILLDTDDVLYLFTDGFIDQANPQRNSFGKQRVKELILKNYQKPMNIQKVILENALAAHQAEAEQRDDITVLGFKF